MKITPETKKILIYGVAIIAAGGVGFYIWSKYSANAGSSGSDAMAASDAAAQAAEQAAQDETQLAEISALGSGGELSSIGSVGSASNIPTEELPADDFSQEVQQILEAAGIQGVANPNSPAAPIQSSPVSNPAPAIAAAPNTVTGRIAPHTALQAPPGTLQSGL